MMHLQTTSATRFPVFIAAAICENSEPTFPARGLPALTTHRKGPSKMAEQDVTRGVRVYKVTHVASGRHYIGITVKEEAFRFRQHVQHATSGRLSTPLHVAIREFGAEAFIVEHIATAFTRKDAGEIEKLLILETNCVTPNGFNGNYGGEPDARWTDEAKARASASHKGRAWTPEFRAKMSVIQQTPEYREKMRAANAKAQADRKPMTEETREKLRQAAIAQFSDPAAREASSERARALMADPDRRALSRDVANRNWADPAYRAKHQGAMDAVFSDEDYRARLNASQSVRMANPALRQKLSESLKRHMSDPENRAKIRAALDASPKVRENRKRMAETNRTFGHLVAGYNKDSK